MGRCNDEESEARFRREAQIAARLEHENIARTLRIEKIDGELCIAQEFVEGVNLGRVMRQLGRAAAADCGGGARGRGRSRVRSATRTGSGGSGSSIGT